MIRSLTSTATAKSPTTLKTTRRSCSNATCAKTGSMQIIFSHLFFRRTWMKTTCWFAGHAYPRWELIKFYRTLNSCRNLAARHLRPTSAKALRRSQKYALWRGRKFRRPRRSRHSDHASKRSKSNSAWTHLPSTWSLVSNSLMFCANVLIATNRSRKSGTSFTPWRTSMTMSCSSWIIWTVRSTKRRQKRWQCSQSSAQLS